jgi:hypothetical protein
MMKLFPFPAPVFAPEDGAGAAAVADPAAAAVDPPAAGAAAAAPAAWFEAPTYDADTQSWLKAKGFADADPVAALSKITKTARNAEKLVGKGPEAVLDRPAQGQALTDWRRANAEALGLPPAEEGYAVTAPEDWPKDAPWDAALEAEARKFAFAQGVDPETHKGYVALFARKMGAMASDAAQGLERANATMMADLQREHGAKTPEVLAQARQAAQHFAAAAGLDDAGVAHVAKVLADGTGDAAAIKFMAAIGKAMGEDSIVAAGKGAVAFGMTPQQAQSELQSFIGPEGEYGKAFNAGDRRRLAELNPKREQLSRLAAMTGPAA